MSLVVNWTASRSGNQYHDGGDDDGNEDGDDVHDREMRRGWGDPGGPAASPDHLVVLMSGNHGGVYADGNHDGVDADEDEEDADEADDNVCEDEVSSKSSQQS